MSDKQETPPEPSKFDPSPYPPDSLFHERRTGRQPRSETRPDDLSLTIGGRSRPDRRKRIDPTTFEKQYTDDELEFMTAMQRFKVQSGKAFPTHGEVLRVARSLGYRQVDQSKDLDSQLILDRPEVDPCSKARARPS